MLFLFPTVAVYSFLPGPSNKILIINHFSNLEVASCAHTVDELSMLSAAQKFTSAKRHSRKLQNYLKCKTKVYMLYKMSKLMSQDNIKTPFVGPTDSLA